MTLTITEHHVYATHFRCLVERHGDIIIFYSINKYIIIASPDHFTDVNTSGSSYPLDTNHEILGELLVGGRKYV